MWETLIFTVSSEKKRAICMIHSYFATQDFSFSHCCWVDLKTLLLEFNLILKIFAVFFGVFAVVADQMSISRRVLDWVLVTCSNISEEHTAFISSVTLKMEAACSSEMPVHLTTKWDKNPKEDYNLKLMLSEQNVNYPVGTETSHHFIALLLINGNLQLTCTILFPLTAYNPSAKAREW